MMTSARANNSDAISIFQAYFLFTHFWLYSDCMKCEALELCVSPHNANFHTHNLCMIAIFYLYTKIMILVISKLQFKKLILVTVFFVVC
jgi:hypothetical protein